MQKRINTCDELAELVSRAGVIPLFNSGLPGFSAEELAEPGHMYTGDEGDPWAWRKALAARGDIIYGKFICGRAAFATPGAYARLSAARRGGMTFEERYAEGTVPRRQKRLMDALRDRPLMSCQLKRAAGFVKGGEERGFDGALIALQMSGDIMISGFERRVSKQGVPYGWEVGVVDLAVRWLGEELAARYDETPESELYAALAEDIHAAVPYVAVSGARAMLESR